MNSSLVLLLPLHLPSSLCGLPCNAGRVACSYADSPFRSIGFFPSCLRFVPAAVKGDDQFSGMEDRQQGMGLKELEQFIQLNVGSWSGFFTQYDVLGNVLQCIPTRLEANCYGKGEEMCLYQTLNVKMAPSKTSIADEIHTDSQWAEFKLAETNLLTVEGRQQVSYFQSGRGYAVSHQTAEMLDKVLRAGVLGEDDDEGENYPPGVKLPSWRPALVCESCLYSEDDNSRLRVFHVLDPRGLTDMIGVFRERKNDGSVPLFKNHMVQDGAQDEVHALLGCWSGHSVIQRTGIYGSTVTEADIDVIFKMEDGGTIVQDILTPTVKFHITGTVVGNLIRFNKGLQMTLLPGGIGLTSPVSVGKCVGQSQSFYLEFSWIYSPGKRRRLVQTYDVDGIVVSTTLVDEKKL